jgi:HEAT repeat protein
VATPVPVTIFCPNCDSEFRARSMGSSYYISGIDTDLRELGSIEEVRRYGVVSCQCCRYSDYVWNFSTEAGQPGEHLSDEEKARLADVLELEPGETLRPLQRPIGDFERFRTAARCFAARGLEVSSQAELALLAYHVARDLGRRDLEPTLRDEAAGLFEKAIDEEEDLPPVLALRYAYVAGELSRRAGRFEVALRFFGKAVAANAELGEDAEHDLDAADLGGLALRMQTRVLHRDDTPEELLALTRDADPVEANEACRLLASRRDRASVEAALVAWSGADPETRTDMLRELVDDPPVTFRAAFLEALAGSSPEDMRMAAQALGALGHQEDAEQLLVALERAVLSTEAPLVEALRRIDAPDSLERVAQIVTSWEQRNAVDDDEWSFSSDPAPLKFLLYTSGLPAGLELLIRDMMLLRENDLWDKVPSGGPVSAALTLSTEAVALALRGLLSSANAAARRWSAYCLAELSAGSGVGDPSEIYEDLRPLLEDPDPVVRMQAASALGRISPTGPGPEHERVVLDELLRLDDADVPFALHFLIPFHSQDVRDYLLGQLQRGPSTPGEVLPLLGRQDLDDELAEILNTSLLDTSDETRAGAVTGLAFTGIPQASSRLRLLYDQEDSDEVRRRIVFGLGRLARAEAGEREETVPFLRQRLGRGNPRLRFSIALTLLQLGDPTGIDIVRERAALFEESFERYDLVAPALKALAQHDALVLAKGASPAAGAPPAG